MRQSSEHEYIGPVNFNLVKRLHEVNGTYLPSVKEVNALFIQGLEALMYHPLKDNLFVVAKFNEESKRCRSISVWDYGSKISDWSIHEPDGDDRRKLQLQISYTYDVQKKRPRNAKRSCNPKVIKQMVSEIRARPLNNEISDLIAHANSLIDAIPEVHKHEGGVNTFFRELYQANTERQLKTLKSILDGGDGGDWPKPYEGFSGSVLDAARFYYDKHMEAVSIKEKYKRHIVGVFASPTGKYRVVRHIVTKGQQDTLIDIYPSIEALPADVLGNLAVLDIAQAGKDDSDRYLQVPGIGCIDGTLKNQYFLIGENFVDPRVESQGQGS